MARGGEHRLRLADLGDLAEIHHQYPVGDETHHVEVVADEHVGEPELALEVHQQVQHLRLHRLVERRDRLVQDDEARLQRQRAGDVDALALAAGELVGIALGEARGLEDSTRARRSRARAMEAAFESPCTCGPKAIEASIVRRGLSEE